MRMWPKAVVAYIEHLKSITPGGLSALDAILLNALKNAPFGKWRKVKYRLKQEG